MLPLFQRACAVELHDQWIILDQHYIGATPPCLDLSFQQYDCKPSMYVRPILWDPLWEGQYFLSDLERPEVLWGYRSLSLKLTLHLGERGHLANSEYGEWPIGSATRYLGRGALQLLNEFGNWN